MDTRKFNLKFSKQVIREFLCDKRVNIKATERYMDLKICKITFEDYMILILEINSARCTAKYLSTFK